MPRPEQGASTSTQSNGRVKGNGSKRSACTSRTWVAPLAATDNPTNVGQMDANKTAAEASWADLYLGEDVGNRYVVDINRLQKFLVTIILVTIYFAWFWQGLGQDHSKGFVEMPGLDGKDTFLWLLGISHAGYLASKATPKTTK